MLENIVLWNSSEDWARQQRLCFHSTSPGLWWFHHVRSSRWCWSRVNITCFDTEHFWHFFGRWAKTCPYVFCLAPHVWEIISGKSHPSGHFVLHVLSPVWKCYLLWMHRLRRLRGGGVGGQGSACRAETVQVWKKPHIHIHNHIYRNVV